MYFELDKVRNTILQKIDRTLGALDRLSKQIRLSPNLSPLAKKLILDAIKTHTNLLQEKWQQIATIGRRGVDIPTEEIRSDLDDLATANSQLEDVLKKYGGQLRLAERSDLREALADGKELEKAFTGILMQRTRIEESIDAYQSSINQPPIPADPTDLAPITTQDNDRAPVSTIDNIIRTQILEPDNITVRIASLNAEVTINTRDLIEQINREVPPETIARELARDIQARTAEPIAEIISRLFSSIVLRELVKEVASIRETTGEVTKNDLENMIRELNSPAAKLAAKLETVTEPETHAKTEITHPIEMQREQTSVAEKVRYELKLVPDAHNLDKPTIIVEIKGEIKVADVSRPVAELIRTVPREVIPQLVAAVCETPLKSRAQVLEFVAEAVKQAFPVGQINETVASKNVTKAIAPAQTNVSAKPVLSLVQNVKATNVKVANVKDTVEVANIVHALINELKAPDQHLSQQSVNQAAAPAPIVETIETILTSLPNALPVLLKEYSSLSSSRESQAQAVRMALEPIICAVATTPAGERYVLNLFAQKAENRLAATDIGRQVIQAVTENVIARAAEVTPNTPLITADKAQQFAVISKLVIAANTDKFEPVRMTPKTAGELLKFVTRVQKCFDPISAKNIKKAAQAAASTKVSSLPPRTLMAAAQRVAAKALREGQIPERVQIMREVLRSVKDDGFIIPQEITKSVFAGLMAVNPTTGKSVVPGLFTLPEETTAARVWEQAVKTLEAQMRGTVKTEGAGADQRQRPDRFRPGFLPGRGAVPGGHDQTNGQADHQ